jgi:hydrogenase-4 component F
MVLTLILILPLLSGAVCLLLRSGRFMAALNVLAFGFDLALGVRLLQRVMESPHVVFEWQGFLSADALSTWMVLLISVVSLATSLYGGRYFRRDMAANVVTPARVKQFHCLTSLFAAGMFLVVLANNLGVMWFALEATALTSVVLVALYNRKTSLEAAWKYVILGSLGLALALFGTVFTYASAVRTQPLGHLPGFNWSQLMAMAPQLDHRMIKIAFVFALVGYGTKAGLAPMHTWLPDAHSEAPSPTSAMLSGVSLKIALYALLRFHMLATQCLGSGFSRTLLLCFGLFSMVLAPSFILVQTNLKRMLAYSSLEHVGLICAGIGMNTSITIFGALLHMGYHALTKPVLFFAAGNIHQTFHSLDLRAIGPGVVKVLPVTAALMGVAAFAAIGLPPFGLFYSEMAVIGGGFAAGQTFISVIILLALLASFCGILKQLSRILLGARKRENRSGGGNEAAAGFVGEPGSLPPRVLDASLWDGTSAMALLLSALLVFSVWLPLPVFRLLRQAAGIIGGAS